MIAHHCDWWPGCKELPIFIAHATQDEFRHREVCQKHLGMAIEMAFPGYSTEEGPDRDYVVTVNVSMNWPVLQQHLEGQRTVHIGGPHV